MPYSDAPLRGPYCDSIALECEAVEDHNERPYIGLTLLKELNRC